MQYLYNYIYYIPDGEPVGESGEVGIGEENSSGEVAIGHENTIGKL